MQGGTGIEIEKLPNRIMWNNEMNVNQIKPCESTAKDISF